MHARRIPGILISGSAVLAAFIALWTQAAGMAAAPAAAPPVLVNPGPQINSDSSSYAQAVLADSPVAYWRMHEATDLSVADSVGVSHGLANAVVGFGQPGALAEGNKAMRFDGADSTRISVPQTSAIATVNGSSAITMEAWINPQSASPQSHFQMFYTFPGNAASYLGVSDASGALKVIVALWIGGRQHHLALGPTLTPGAWYHTVATYEGSRLTLYVNGTVVGQITGLAGAISLGTQGVMLGAHPSAGNGYGFNGLVDEAALYGYALTPAQVEAHYGKRTVGGAGVSLQLAATDPDGDRLTFGASGLPSSIGLNPDTGLISGTLGRADAGSYDVTVTASDGLQTHSQTFTWTVTHVNRAPAVRNPGNLINTAGTSASVAVSATDPDGDALTYAAAGLPPTFAVDSATGLLSGSSTPSDIGVYLVTITASDGHLSDRQTFAWTIASANRAPVLANPGDQTTTGRALGYVDKVLSDGPVSYWRLGEGTGSQVADSIGSNSGVIEGGVRLGEPGVLADGNTSMRFDGLGGSRVAIPGSPALAAIDGSSAVTMEAWITPQTAVLPSGFSMFYSFPGRPASYLGVTSAFGGFKAIVALWINGRQRYLALGPSLTVGAYHHIVATYDGSTLVLYVNGLPVGQLTGLSGSLSIGTAGMMLGNHPSNGYAFDGLVDEAALYNHALTAAQIGAHYARRAAGGTAVALQLAATDADADTLTFGATGLPASLTIDAATGLISGVISSEGGAVHQVTVTVSDGHYSRSETFTWTITSLKAYADAVVGDAPAAFWRLADVSGTAVADSIGGSPGARAETVKSGQNGALADGNAAMDFDGVDGTVVSVGNSPALAALTGTTAITMEAWINPQTLTLPSRFRMFFSFPGNPASYLGITDAFGGLKVIAALWINGRQRYLAVGPNLSVGSWYHTVATYDGSRLALYVNGALVGQITGLSGPLTIGKAGLVLGGHPSRGYTYNFDGLVDEAAIYSYALTPAQIATHYALRRSAPLTALTLTADRSAPQPAGVPVTFTANAAGGSGPHEFKWWRYSTTAGWIVLRDWSTAPSYTWTPTAADPNAWVTVWARSAGDPTDAPEKSADLPHPVFVVSSLTTAFLTVPAEIEEINESQVLRWNAVAGATAYRIQIGTSLGASDLADSGEIQKTFYDLSDVGPTLGELTAPLSVAWDFDEAQSLAVEGYAMALNEERTDLGRLLPTNCQGPGYGAPCYRILLPPLRPGAHVVSVSAYNTTGETIAPPAIAFPTEPSIFVRLWTKYAGVWRYSDRAFALSDAAARFLYPAPGAVRVDVTKPLRWTASPFAEAYSLLITRQEDGFELLNEPELHDTAFLAPTLPGSVTLLARLGTRVAGVWRYTTTTFAATPAVAHLDSPRPWAERIGPTTPFVWRSIPQAQGYRLQLGTTPGGADLADSGVIGDTWFIATAIPASATVHARLSTKYKGVWRHVDSVHSSKPAVEESGAVFIAPLDGSEVNPDSVAFRWTEFAGAIGYHLHLGTTPGADDIDMSPDYMTETAWTSTGLPRGAVLYARLYTQMRIGDWDRYVDIVISTPPLPAPER